MGLNISSATSVALLTFLAAKLGGMRGALTVWGCLFFVVAIITKFGVKNYPEECGAYPDNDPNADRKEDSKLHTGWTIKKVLKDKTMWSTGIACGFQGLIVVGFVSHLVPLLLSRGMDQGGALRIMTIASIGGAVGSYVWGYIDQKFGLKIATIALSAWMLIGCVMYLLPGAVPAF